MNYTELKTAIADWAHRSDITDSTLDLFIDLAEAEFNNRLRTAEQETVADLVCTSRYTALPADLAEIRVVEHNGTRLRNLEYATPDYMARWRTARRILDSGISLKATTWISSRWTRSVCRRTSSNSTLKDASGPR